MERIPRHQRTAMLAVAVIILIAAIILAILDSQTARQPLPPTPETEAAIDSFVRDINQAEAADSAARLEQEKSLEHNPFDHPIPRTK